jgi:hypothetical protein
MVRVDQDADSAEGSRLGLHALPFSFEQVLSYFDGAFGYPAYKIRDNTFVYLEGNASDEAVTIAVSATARQIAVTLLARGDFGVNYIREFFEAPFFLRSEREQLYALLDANPGARSAWSVRREDRCFRNARMDHYRSGIQPARR